MHQGVVGGRELGHPAGAVYVRAALVGVADRQIVDRTQMDHVIDAAGVAQQDQGVVGEAQPVDGQVADDGGHPVGVGVPEVVEDGGETGERGLAHQGDHPGVVALQQAVQDPSTDESGRAGHEVGRHWNRFSHLYRRGSG